MPYDGFGNFTRDYNWTADKVALIKIQSARMDGEFDNYASALNQVMLRSGVAPMTGALKMGGNSVTGVAAGSAASPSYSFGTDTTSGMFLPSAGVLGFAAAGIEKFRINYIGIITNGSIGINTTTPRTALDVTGNTSLHSIFEEMQFSITAISGAVNVDANNVGVFLYTANAAGNWTFNIRGDVVTSLNAAMAVGQSFTTAIEVPQGPTPFYCTGITVDGAAPSQVKWFNGGAPTLGNASGIDVYTITVLKHGANDFYVRASQAQVK